MARLRVPAARAPKRPPRNVGELRNAAVPVLLRCDYSVLQAWRATCVAVLAAGSLTEAQETADGAVTERATFDGGGYAELAILHAAAEAHRLWGDAAGAAARAERAWQKRRTDVAGFADSEARARVLNDVPLHAAIAAGRTV